MVELSFWSALMLGFAMMLIIEGLIYGLFPGLIKEFLQQLQSLSPSQIKALGFTCVLCGACTVKLLLSL